MKSSLFVIAACILWALDLLVRYPITLKLSFINIIFLEASLGLIFISPWLLEHGKKQFSSFSKKDWLLSLFIGGIGMAVGGLLFNSSIQKITPGTFAFFQMFQPMIVVFAAYIFLKEKIDNLYYFWSIWVLISALLMYSQDLELSLMANDFTNNALAIFTATLVMVIWGLCTVAAKSLLKRHSPTSVMTVRWIFAFIFSGLIILYKGEAVSTDMLLQDDFLWRLVFLGVFAGIMAMWLYYKGLSALPAGQVSFLELSYPAFGMIFSSIYTFEAMNFLQSIGAVSFFAFLALMLAKHSPTEQ